MNTGFGFEPRMDTKDHEWEGALPLVIECRQAALRLFAILRVHSWFLEMDLEA